MKKQLLGLCLFATTSLFATNPTKSMISIDYHGGTINQTYGSTATEGNRDKERFGLKIGATGDVKRLFLAYRQEVIHNGAFDDTTGFSFSIEYEGLAAENGSGLFAGLITGYENYDFIGYDGVVRTQSDFIYGVDIGVTLLAGDTIGMDVGLRYTLPLNPNGTADYKTIQTSTVYIGINYLYDQ